MKPLDNLGNGSLEEVGRKKPSQGVRMDVGDKGIVFVTVCAKDRVPWMACEEAHRLLVNVWREAAAWLVGPYVLMPDHLHLFAAPRDLRFGIDNWITFWKSRFSRAHSHAGWLWQSQAFHHRLRREEDFSEKCNYARQNPVRAGLVKTAPEWPYQGTLHDLRF